MPCEESAAGPHHASWSSGLLRQAGEVSSQNPVPFFQEDDSFRRISDLPDISGPGIGEQLLFGIRVDCRKSLVEVLIETLDEIAEEGKDILFADPQGRDEQPDHIEPEVKIGPKVSLLDLLLQGPCLSRQ